MASFTFTSSDGKPFALKGPEGLSREQAEAIFKKQDSTGSLVGFKPGEALSAATQASAGLAKAQGALQQAQSGLAGAIGSVGSVASIGSISTALSAAGGAGGGSLAATASGLTALVGPAVSAVSGAVSGLAKAGAPLVGGGVVQGSTAISAIQTINKTISSFSITNPINISDFTKVAGASAGALSKIGPLSIPEVNGVLAQAKNLAGQASSAISNSTGVGSFGLSVGQLETAGYVKPGTAALAASVGSTLSSVVNSPAAWTGKDGIKSVTDLLSSDSKQSQIQQDLMTKGVAGLGAVGVPVQNLSSQGLAGMALNAAKDLPSAEAFAKGLPIPGDATGAVQAAFSSAVRDGAFAVNLVNTKIPTVFKQQDIPVPKIDTVNRATLDAASSRIVGDNKVPVPDYVAKQTLENQADGEAYVTKSTKLLNEYLNPTGIKFEAISNKLAALENQQSITSDAWAAINNEYTQARYAYNNGGGPELAGEVINLYDRLTRAQQQVVTGQLNDPKRITNLITYLLGQSKSIRERLANVSYKIEGRGEGE
jgi:hypothetical protein